MESFETFHFVVGKKVREQMEKVMDRVDEAAADKPGAIWAQVFFDGDRKRMMLKGGFFTHKEGRRIQNLVSDIIDASEP